MINYLLRRGVRATGSVWRGAAARGLTQAERDRVPIIRAADAPAAIAGFGVAEQCAAAPGQTMICIRMEQIQTYGGEYYERYER